MVRAIAMAGLLAALAAPASAHPTDVGTITLDNAPVYHGAADFHWSLTKKPRYATLGVFCSQGGWVYIAELSVGQAMTGSASVLIENEMSSALPGHIDYTRPSDCQAFVFDERLVRQDKPPALTDQVFFAIEEIP